MIVCALIVLPLAAGLLAWASARHDPHRPRWVSLFALAAEAALLVPLWFEAPGTPWIAEFHASWIPAMGIGFHVAVDGVSLLLLLLTAFLGIMAVLASWNETGPRAGFFHFILLSTLAGVVGVFTALDLFLFYFFWELMLVPMYFFIALWGHEGRRAAAVKFFLFTQLSGLLMLAAILALYFVHGSATGLYTFDAPELANTPMGAGAARLILLGFLASFLVKLPAFPLHTWLPDAHTEAPTAGSMILAGLLLKTGAYGLFRFAVPLLPAAALELAPAMMALAVAGILYGAVLAFAQTDLKRLVAYTSVSHMGFVLLGLFAWNETALQGALIQVLSHGIGTGALFMIAGALQDRMETRDMEKMGGLWSVTPRLGGAWIFFSMGALGLPGLGNFVGEFLVILGTWPVSRPAAALAAAGLVVSTVYAVRMVGAVLFGPRGDERPLGDLTTRETAALAVMMAALLWIGLFPSSFMEKARQGQHGVHASAVRESPASQGGSDGGP